MARYPERLILLTELCEGLLSRVLSVKNNPIKVLQDQNFAKVGAALVKAFPEVPSNLDKVTGSDQLKSRSTELATQLQESYLTFFDVLQFKEATVEVLLDMSTSVSNFQYDTNPDLMVWFMDLIVGYMKLMIMVSRVSERKLMMALFGRGYYNENNTSEPNFSRVAQLVIEADNPIHHIQSHLAALGPRIGETLSTLMFSYCKALTPSILRKEHTLNPIPKTDAVAAPVLDHFVLQLAHVDKYTEWIIYGCLACPSQLMKTDVWKQALTDGFVVHVFGDEVLFPHQEFDQQVINIKGSKHSSLKKTFAEVATNCVGGSGLVHRERRSLYMLELQNMVNVYSDSPGLLGPKIPQLFSALALARAEVVWYYRHQNRTPPKSKAKFNAADFTDDRLSTLVHLIDTLQQLVKDHTGIVQKYHIEFLAGADLSELKAVLAQCDSSSWESGVKEIIDTITQDLGKLSPSIIDQQKCYDLEQLRLSIFKVIAYFSSTQFKGGHNSVKDLLPVLNTIIIHTRCVDAVDLLMQEYGTLKELYWYKDLYFKMFEKAVAGTNNEPLNVISCLRVLNHFHENGHPFIPDDRAAVGKEAVQLGIKYLRTIMTRLEQLLIAINGMNGYEILRRQLAPVRAENFLKKKPNARTPGYESYPSQAHLLQKFNGFLVNLAQLCAAINGVDNIVIYDHEFVPREWVHTLLALVIRKYLGTGVDGLGNILRPSVVEKAVQDYINVLKLIESYVGINVGNVVMQALLEQFCDLGLTSQLQEEIESGLLRPRDAATNASSESGKKEKTQYIRRLSSWFSKFIQKQVPEEHLVFSPARRAFISKLGSEFKAEEFVDYVELRSLCNMVGPYGVRAIDHEILTVVSQLTKGVMEVLGENRSQLGDLLKNVSDEARCHHTIRNLRSLDTFITYMTKIGTALCLRDLMHLAMSDVTENNIPLFKAAIKNAYAQYEHPIPLRQVTKAQAIQLAAMDQAACDCGVVDASSDAMLRAAFAPANQNQQDGDLWALLPVMCAASLSHSSWKDAEFNTQLEGHVNNYHTMAEGFRTTIIMMNHISGARGAANHPTVSQDLMTFVHHASILVLRQGRSREHESVYVFLDRFIQQCDVLSRSGVESSMPYALVRAAYVSVYEDKKKDLAQLKKEAQQPAALRDPGFA